MKPDGTKERWEIAKELECSEEELLQCDRCELIEHESTFHRNEYRCYCECCHDDMCVPWGKK